MFGRAINSIFERLGSKNVKFAIPWVDFLRQVSVSGATTQYKVTSFRPLAYILETDPDLILE